MADLQGLKRSVASKLVAVVIAGVAAGCLDALQGFLAVEFPRHDTTVTVAGQAGTSEC